MGDKILNLTYFKLVLYPLTTYISVSKIQETNTKKRSPNSIYLLLALTICFYLHILELSIKDRFFCGCIVSLSSVHQKSYYKVTLNNYICVFWGLFILLICKTFSKNTKAHMNKRNDGNFITCAQSYFSIFLALT